MFSAPRGYVAVPMMNQSETSTQFFTFRQPLKTQLCFVTRCSLKTAALNSVEAKALHEY